MELERLPDTLAELVYAATPPRSVGLHLSDVIWSILQTTDPGKYNAGPVNPLWTDPGFTFERVLETAWASRRANLFRPDEIVRDGIACSPDYIDLTYRADGEIIESKMTEMSSVGCPTEPKFRKWLWQIAAYCYVCGIDHARLHVLFLRGDYKKVRREYGVWRIVWTAKELEDTWQMLVNHARQRGWLTQTPHGLVWSGSLPQRNEAA